MKTAGVTVPLTAAAALMGFFGYRQGEQAGRAQGCNNGVRIENSLGSHGISDASLATSCQGREPSAAVGPSSAALEPTGKGSIAAMGAGIRPAVYLPE